MLLIPTMNTDTKCKLKNTTNQDLLNTINNLKEKIAIDAHCIENLTNENKKLSKEIEKSNYKLAAALDEANTLKSKLENSIKEQFAIAARLNDLIAIEKEYNNMKKELLDIKISAELASAELIEESESQAMESMMVINDILKEVDILKKDISSLQPDLKIGVMTINYRINSFDACIKSFSDKLINIKDEFYKRYNLD